MNGDVIRGYYAAYQSKDRAAIEALVSADFTFTSPYDDHIDRARYFEKCWPNSGEHQTFWIEKLFENGDEAFVRYKIELKSGVAFRNTEFLRLRDGKICEVEVYFGSDKGTVDD
jgi:ketosteroid isomerase-like protein